jgi:hypothetical protein
VDLDGLLRRADGEAAGLELRLRGRQREVPALVLEERRLVGQEPCGLDLGRHVGELGLDGLELRDRLAERLALLGVGQRLVERALREADAHRRDPDAPDVEDVQELLEPGAARAQEVLLRHAALGERQRPRVRRVPAHLPVRLALLVAGRAVLDDDVRDLRVTVAGAGDGRDRDVPGDVGAGVGDELLGAVDDPLRALEARAGLRVAGVAARLRLGEPEGAEAPAGAQIGQVALLLLLGAEQVDRLRAERRVRAHRDRHGRVDPRELLDGDRVGQRVAARAAVLLGERDAHEPELAELRDDLVREALLAIELLGHRRDLVAGEVADGLLDEAVVVGQVEEHRGVNLDG